MNCPVCGENNSRVIDTRDRGTWRRRRHECVMCGARWTTQEVPERDLERLIQVRELAEKLRGVL